MPIGYSEKGYTWSGRFDVNSPTNTNSFSYSFLFSNTLNGENNSYLSTIIDNGGMIF